MGGCGTHSYRNISQEKIDLALKALKKSGAGIKGNNPWTVDTHYFGVKITANWDQNGQTLNLTVTDSDGTIPCPIIWNYLDNIVAKYK
jgi:hypothetical protein